MRLFDVLRRQKIPFPEGTELIIADPVWKEIDDGPDRTWKADDFPNLAPPFPSFCIEARSDRINELFILAHFRDMTDWVNQNHVKTAFQGIRPPETTWVLGMTTYQGIQVDAAQWYLFGYPGLIFLHIGPDGRWLDKADAVSFWVKDEFAGKDKNYYLSHAAMTQRDAEDTMPTAFTALSLLHCKNVSMEKVKESRQQRRAYERKYGAPLAEYHVLTIRPVGPVGKDRTAPAIQAVGLNREHIVRGHFKHFTQDAPLFGKITGMYWWADQVRGNPKRGQIVKDYNLEGVDHV